MFEFFSTTLTELSFEIRDECDGAEDEGVDCGIFNAKGGTVNVSDVSRRSFISSNSGRS